MKRRPADSVRLRKGLLRLGLRSLREKMLLRINERDAPFKQQMAGDSARTGGIAEIRVSNQSLPIRRRIATNRVS